MYAVVEIAGQQYKVKEADRLFVPMLPSEIGATVKFENVLLLADDKGAKIGTPHVKGSFVQARVAGHVKDEKVIVFRKKKTKGFKVRKGHRQQFTEIEITKVA